MSGCFVGFPGFGASHEDDYILNFVSAPPTSPFVYTQPFSDTFIPDEIAVEVPTGADPMWAFEWRTLVENGDISDVLVITVVDPDGDDVDSLITTGVVAASGPTSGQVIVPAEAAARWGGLSNFAIRYEWSWTVPAAGGGVRAFDNFTISVDVSDDPPPVGVGFIVGQVAMGAGRGLAG